MSIRGRRPHSHVRRLRTPPATARAAVDVEIAETVVKDPRVVAVGDGLFPDHAPGQTWRFTPWGDR